MTINNKKSLTPDSVADSIISIPQQISDCLKQSKNFKLPSNYKKINKVVVSGMGGSNLAGRIFDAVFAKQIKAPIVINADYEIPAWVGPDTLFICSSYSGGTEETLAAYREAKKKKAKIVCLTSLEPDNKLIKLAKADKLPCLAFNPQFNPSGQPRLALGYAIFSLASVLQAANLIKINTKDLKLSLKKLDIWNNLLLPSKSNNAACKVAKQIAGRAPTLIVGPFLAGNAHALRNQINENSKNSADYLILSDLNHHALEGLSFPTINKESKIWVFFESGVYSPRIQKRLTLTKQVASKNKILIATHKLNGKNELEQALEMLQFGSWLTYYLANINGVDPLSIPWVDWFKSQLK